MTLSFLESDEDLSRFEEKSTGMLQIQVTGKTQIHQVVEHLKNPSIQLCGFILHQIGKVKMDQEVFYSLGPPSIGEEPNTFVIPMIVYFPKA